MTKTIVYVARKKEGRKERKAIMRQHSLLSLSSLLAFATLGLGSRKTFNVHDDVLAFPQVRNYIFVFINKKMKGEHMYRLTNKPLSQSSL